MKNPGVSACARALTLFAALGVCSCAGHGAALQVLPNDRGATLQSRLHGPSVHAMSTRHSPPPGAGDLLYHGGSIQKRPGVYLVFWGWNADPDHVAPYLTSFLKNVGGTPWLDITTQYYSDSQGYIRKAPNALLGTWSDASAVPQAPQYSDLAGETAKAVQHFGFDASAAYIIATPTGAHGDGFGSAWCAWHSTAWTPAGVAGFINLPYMPDAGYACGAYAVNSGTAGILDGVSIVAGHELAETQTDPFLDAWYDADLQEIADKCLWQNLANITVFKSSYAVQSLWSNAAARVGTGCVLTAKAR